MRAFSPVLVLALFARAEDPEPAPGVSVEISSEKTEFAIGDPILLDVVYRNEGQETWEVNEPHVLRFYDPFEVRDAAGARVPNPFGDIDYVSYDGPVTSHKLLPGGTVTLRKYANESAAFDKPGEYVVTVRSGHFGGIGRPCLGKPFRVTILPAPDKKTRDAIVADLKALSRDTWGKLLEREEYARYRPHVREINCEHDALRLLAFRREQELLPFWIERLGDHEPSAYAAEALAGLPDRATVLKALEERLDRGERDGLVWLYTCLAAPSDGVDEKTVRARRREIEERYREK